MKIGSLEMVLWHCSIFTTHYAALDHAEGFKALSRSAAAGEKRTTV